MAVVENGGSNNHVEPNDVDQSKSSISKSRSSDQHQSSDQQKKMTTPNGNGGLLYGNSVSNNHQHQMAMNGVDQEEEGFKKEMRDLAEMLSKLNPMAAEFVPPSLSNNQTRSFLVPPSPAAHFGYAAINNFLLQTNNTAFTNANSNGNSARRKSNFNHGKRRMNSRTSMAQREDVIKRTVYVSDIDHQVTEEQLAALFINCGQVVDCRVCGDPNSVLRFAFIEFTDEEGARNALSLGGTMLGYYPVRVLPSKTAIAPVNPTFLPRSEDEREMCARTIYCTNIDKKVTQADVKLFFESLCGEVYRLRLLGDYHHSTRIAFVEFVMAESAIAALNCSGVVLGSLPIRVSPSKTPVRPRAPRPVVH
ncbi:polyadenylate-binding protein-interacting protein 12-like isoform X2 [Cynara cardunculus var. scolymus]|uniref:polyadenylate-binding protein-interacting protein 12-like isoform X2 n=1 Tax=Cynara cardunculus var. scolymus TaxID=59895 RepID=UPI000D62EB7B|nr:polyadenylate-binding protein-interacting protein 12-like isoform X2 [Cynara cardunculus var. scolymus]